MAKLADCPTVALSSRASNKRDGADDLAGKIGKKLAESPIVMAALAGSILPPGLSAAPPGRPVSRLFLPL
jgi:hypothetical protein